MTEDIVTKMQQFNTWIWPILKEMNTNVYPNCDGAWIYEIRNHYYYHGGLKSVIHELQNDLDKCRDELAFETSDCDCEQKMYCHDLDLIRELKNQARGFENAIHSLKQLNIK